jgi:hypothetical protein
LAGRAEPCIWRGKGPDTLGRRRNISYCTCIAATTVESRGIAKRKMTAPSHVTTSLRSDLNAFLFADVGTEANGMILSVVSVFARQGNDPWREADRLAGLPKAQATESLAQAIAGMPKSLWCLPDAVTIAVRLIGLLPVRPAREAGRGVSRPTARTVVLLVCIALGFGYAITATMRPGPPARFDGSDVGSFAAPAPADSQQEGQHR